MSDGDPRFHELLREIRPRFLELVEEILNESGELHDQKQRDYGTEGDPFANVRASQQFAVPPWVGALVRMNDKLTRVKSFLTNGVLANESLEDSLRDMMVYAGIALILYREDHEAVRQAF